MISVHIITESEGSEQLRRLGITPTNTEIGLREGFIERDHILAIYEADGGTNVILTGDITIGVKESIYELEQMIKIYDRA